MTEYLPELLMAFAGTYAFSVLFCVSQRHRLTCALIGMSGWFIYLLVNRMGASPNIATFVSAAALCAMSRFLAVYRRTPTIVLLIPGIFTLVPGAGIYYTAYYFFFDQSAQAFSYGFGTLKTAIAIALGIGAAYCIPARLYGWKQESEVWFENTHRKS